MDKEQIVKSLTIEQKVKLLTGESFWKTHAIKALDLPSITLTDGPHGLRKSVSHDALNTLNESVKAVAYPTAATLANSFDESLIESVGRQIALHAKAEDISVLLAPGVNIKRSPLCGRNFEYFSEDPYLAGKCGARFIRGVESTGVMASLKHFAVNNQETRRMTIDSVVDERALREIYLKPFEIAIKEGKPSTVMTAYNKVNGIYASEHSTLLKTILRNEWHYKGLILSDWGAVNDRVLSLKAGLDLEMPGPSLDNQKTIIHAIRHKTLPMRMVNESIQRYLDVLEKAIAIKKEAIDLKEDHKLALKAAEKSLVLLKNNDQLLPFKKDQSFGLIGALAENARIQGGGSSKVNPTKVISLKNALLDYEAKFIYTPGYTIKDQPTDEDAIKKAVKIAKEKDVIVLAIGLTDDYETEGLDRTHLKIPRNQFEMVKAVKAVNNNIVYVLFGGAPFQIPYESEAKAIIHAYLPGQAGGKAISKALFGEINPSGKLNETWPLKLSDVPSVQYFANQPYYQHYRESIYVGYRYYDKAEKAVLYPFGHGLSYTTFEYSDLKINKKILAEKEWVDISVTVTNTGEYDGEEVVQLYVKNAESQLFKADKELKGFKKIALEKGQSKTVKFSLSHHDFYYYHSKRNRFVTERGEYKLLLASSSKDIRLSTTLDVTTQRNIQPPVYKETAPSYYSLKSEPFTVSTKQFQAINTYPVPTEPPKKITLNTPLEDLKHTIIGTKLYERVQREMKDADLMTKSMMKTIPLRTLSTMSQGRFKKKTAIVMVDFMNHQFLKGIKHYFSRS